ncbi:MAG TPA: SMP-30/gluconolactonase/LRE family protein [Humisphaera sp.]
MRTRFLPAAAVVVLFLAAAPAARAGYETPCYIDGCKSADGRFVVTAALVGKVTNHGPNKWQFTWKDAKTGETSTFDAKEVQAGQVHAQLFVAPDGQTFALFNHVTMWTSGKSDMHGSGKLPQDRADPAWRKLEEFTHRLVVYRKDGSVVKVLGVGDFVREEEWAEVLPVFNRVHWVKEYDGLNFKKVPRVQYAFYRVSPDYTVLEFRVVPPRASKDKAGRAVRVSLTDGRIIPNDEPLAKEKTPVRPFVGPDALEAANIEREGYTPSLDPVREAGTFVAPAPKPAAAAPASPAKEKKDDAKARPAAAADAKVASVLPAKLELVKDGFAKADTPAWVPAAKAVVFTDLDGKKTYALDAVGEVKPVRDESARAKAGPDGRLYGVFGGRFCSWLPGEEPRAIAEKAAGGKEFSVNDVAVSARFAYLTTLKDPEKGRLSVVDLKTGAETVAYDGEQEPGLANPNGVALSPDGKWLYLGVSNYKEKGKSGVYRFPVRDDGTVDVAAGREKRWAPVQGPDGIVVAADGTVCFTAGGEVVAFNADGKKVGSVKIPKGSGTNLCFGGPEGRTLYVTTNNAVYVGK